MRFRRTLLGLFAVTCLSSPVPALAQTSGGWTSLPSWADIGGMLMLVPGAEAAVMFRNPYLGGFMPPDAPGTAIVNDNGIGGSSNQLFNLPVASLSAFLAFDYSTGWMFQTPGIQSVFGNSDTVGQSSFRVDIFPPGTMGSTTPALVIRIEELPINEELVWVVPNMINNTGTFVAHNVLISIRGDGTNTFQVQVAQDNSMYTAYLANPATLVAEPNVPPNSGPVGQDFLIPWKNSAYSNLTYYVGNRVVPTGKPGLYIPGAIFDGFPNDYYAFQGALGRVVAWPQSPVDVRTLIINGTFEGPSPGGGEPGKFTILPLGGAGVIFGTPAINGIVPASGSVQPSIYLIGGTTFPPLSSPLPPVVFTTNQGIIPASGDEPTINTSFYTPVPPPPSPPYLTVEPYTQFLDDYLNPP